MSRKAPDADLFAAADALAEREDLPPQVRAQADVYRKQRDGKVGRLFAKALVRSAELYDQADAGDDLSDLKVGDLKAEIDRRNEGRDEAELIVPGGRLKADLLAALKADDERA